MANDSTDSEISALGISGAFDGFARGSEPSFQVKHALTS